MQTITIPVCGPGIVPTGVLGTMKMGLELAETYTYSHKGRGIKPHSHGKGRRRMGRRR